MNLDQFADRRLLQLTDEAHLIAQARLGRRPGPAVSLARCIQQMASDGLSGREREFAEETARHTSSGFDPHRLYVPWKTFTRDMEVGTGSPLVGVDVLPAQDILRPWS